MLAALCALVRFTTAKTIDIQFVRGGVNAAINNWRQLDAGIQQFALERDTNTLVTAEQVFRFLTNEPYLRSTFGETPVKLEPTPGNITLRETNDAVQVLWYDVDGAEHATAKRPTRNERPIAHHRVLE